MFVVQVSLLTDTFFVLISQILSVMQTTKEVNPHPHIALCVNQYMKCHFFPIFFYFFLMLLVECWCMHMPHHPGRPSGVDHTTPLKRCTLCYSRVSRATPSLQYHASMLTLQNFVISRALWLP